MTVPLPSSAELTTIMATASKTESSYERLLSWTSVAPVVLLLVLLVEWELLRTSGTRVSSAARISMAVLAAPLGVLVAMIGLVRATKLVG